MIKAAGCRGAAILLSLFLTAAAVTGCGGKYEQVPLPAREETQVSESEDAQAPGESVEGAQGRAGGTGSGRRRGGRDELFGERIDDCQRFYGSG